MTRLLENILDLDVYG